MALTVVDQGLLGTNAQYTGFKNRIINGAMGIWQRGTTGFGPGGYGADRWYLDGVSATSQRSTDVPSTAFPYSNEWGYPGTASCSIRQRIESVNSADLAGQTITVSLWAKSISGTTSLSYSLDYPTATDNFSSLTNISSFVQIGAASLSTSWTYYTFTVSIPAGATTGLQLSFNRNTGGPATTRITGVQLEKGSTATSFDYRPYGTELALCQRYYEAVTSTMGYWYSVRNDGASRLVLPWLVQKRTAPTATLSGNVNSGSFTTLATVLSTSVWNADCGAGSNCSFSQYTSSAEL
jgi:hypothetical protein